MISTALLMTISMPKRTHPLEQVYILLEPRFIESSSSRCEQIECGCHRRCVICVSMVCMLYSYLFVVYKLYIHQPG